METKTLAILAIDDIRDNLTALRAVVAEQLPGTRLLTALDGPTGLAMARAEDPDVILLDIVMPGMDGFAVCRQLKADERLRAIPVIFLTAMRTDRESRVDALEAGAEGFLAKPFDEVELTAQIRAMAKIKTANRLQRRENEQLAELVVERTRELERELAEHKQAEQEREKLEEQLRISQKMEAIGSLAGGVAHDFNNMLNVIIGYGEIVLRKLQADDPLREDVKEIIKAGERSAMLTRQLLAFSRKQVWQPEVFDLNVLVENLEKMLRRLIREDIDLRLTLAAEYARVRADPGQLEQVVVNLAINARDAMQYGGILTIETADVELDGRCLSEPVGAAPGRYVLIAVTDTGCGMSKAIISRIFEPFFTTKEKGSGTGLGLSTVYGIVKQSGGHIVVFSEPGCGTTFKIYLPATSALPEIKNIRQVEEVCPDHGKSILVVEDEESLRALFARLLSGWGYEVTIAANGGEALLLVEENGLQPDLIISDIVMPGMNGPVLVDRLRRQRADLRVLFMSGYIDDAILDQSVLTPETLFIGKPFNIKDLAAKIKEAMQRG